MLANLGTDDEPSQPGQPPRGDGDIDMPDVGGKSSSCSYNSQVSSIDTGLALGVRGCEFLVKIECA